MSELYDPVDLSRRRLRFLVDKHRKNDISGVEVEMMQSLGASLAPILLDHLEAVERQLAVLLAEKVLRKCKKPLRITPPTT